VFPTFSSREVTSGQMRKTGIHFIIYRSVASSTALAVNSRFVAASLPVGAKSNAVSLVRRSNKNKIRAFLKTGWCFGNRNSIRPTLREVLVLFVYIQSEPMNVSAWVGYVHNLYSDL